MPVLIYGMLKSRRNFVNLVGELALTQNKSAIKKLLEDWQISKNIVSARDRWVTRYMKKLEGNGLELNMKQIPKWEAVSEWHWQGYGSKTVGERQVNNS